MEGEEGKGEKRLEEKGNGLLSEVKKKEPAQSSSPQGHCVRQSIVKAREDLASGSVLTHVSFRHNGTDMNKCTFKPIRKMNEAIESR